MNRLLDEVQQNENDRKEIVENNNQNSPETNNTVPNNMQNNEILDFDATQTNNNHQVDQNFMNTKGVEISRIEQGHDDLSRNMGDLDILAMTDSKAPEQAKDQVLDFSNAQNDTTQTAGNNMPSGEAKQENTGLGSQQVPKEMPNFDDLDFDDFSSPIVQPVQPVIAEVQEIVQQPPQTDNTQPKPVSNDNLPTPQLEKSNSTPAPPKSPEPQASSGFDDIFDAPKPKPSNPNPSDSNINSQRSLKNNKTSGRRKSEKVDEDDAHLYADTEGYDDEPGGYFNQNLYQNDDDEDYFSGGDEHYDSYKRNDTEKNSHRGSKVGKPAKNDDDFL